MTTEPPIRERPSARIILLDEHNHVLLFEYDDPNYFSPEHPGSRFWCTPGGGIEPGETIEETARRELWEETAITNAVFGAELGTVSADLTVYGELVRHVNHFILARAPRQDLGFDNLGGYEASTFLRHRWWSYEELISESADVRPRQTLELIQEAIAKVARH
ncbi:hypothetical protein BH09CHL1_BH09CHL1_14010 [soil metagenome]